MGIVPRYSIFDLAVLKKGQNPAAVLEADMEEHISKLISETLRLSQTTQIPRSPPEQPTFTYRILKFEVIQNADVHLNAETLAVLDRHDIKEVFLSLLQEVLQIKVIGQISINNGKSRGITIDIVPGTSPDKSKVGYLVVSLFQKTGVRSLITSNGLCKSLSLLTFSLPGYIDNLAIWLHSMD